MNAQRYTPAELDEIADQCRDEAVRMWTVGVPMEVRRLGERNVWLMEIDTHVRLATLLHQDAERLRRNARLMQKTD